MPSSIGFIRWHIDLTYTVASTSARDLIRRQLLQRSRPVKELSARKLGIPPDRTGAGGMMNTEVLDHTLRDFPRLVPPRRDPVRGRLPPGRPFSLFIDP